MQKLIIRLKEGDRTKIFFLNEASVLIGEGTIEVYRPGCNPQSYRVATQARSKEPGKAIDIEMLFCGNDIVRLYELK